MPADMLIKVIRVGIPIIISNAAPAASGYEIAKKGNITILQRDYTCLNKTY